MTENNAAQAAGKILTYLGFAQAMSMEPGVDRRRDHIQSLIESTLLSELRAEGVQAGDPAADATLPDVLPELMTDGGAQYVSMATMQTVLRAARAMLRAPVAGEAQPVAWMVDWPDEPDLGHTLLEDPVPGARNRALVIRDAAPQASTEPLARYCPGCGSVGPVGDEYRDCCPDGNQARMIPARLAEKCRDTFRLAIQALLADAAANDGAAPQASEAVRILFPTHLRKMWSGGEVQAWLDNHQGITPPTASAKGSLERYRDWRAEQAEADKDGVRSEGHQ